MISLRLPSYRWAFDQGYRALNYEFRFRSDSVHFARRVDRCLAAFRNPSTRKQVLAYSIVHMRDEDLPVTLYVDDAKLSSAKHPSSLLAALLVHVNQRAIESVNGSLAIHAGAVSQGGRGLVLPAPPDSGKSTLVAGLTRAGFSYLSDEVALIDIRSKRVCPYARPLALEWPSLKAVFGDTSPLARGASRKLAGFPSYVAPSMLTRRPLGQPCPVRFVIAPQYRQGATTVLEPMSRAEAVMWMASNAFNLQTLGRDGVPVLADLAANSDCYRLQIGDLRSAIEVVSHLVARPVAAESGAIG